MVIINIFVKGRFIDIFKDTEDAPKSFIRIFDYFESIS